MGEHIKRYGMGPPIWYDLPKTMSTTTHERKTVWRTTKSMHRRQGAKTKKGCMHRQAGTPQHSNRYRLSPSYHHHHHRHRFHHTTHQHFRPRKNYSREKRTP